MNDILRAFDGYLTNLNLRFHAVVIGGAALITMGIIKRTTKDVDCLDPDIPDPVKQASKIFALEHPNLGLDENWLNNGPASLKADLPVGWQDQLIQLFSGVAVELYTLGRLDLLRTKLFAYCDRQQDEDDCAALLPTLDELRICLPWLLERDGNPYWPENVKAALRQLAKRLGYEYNP